MQVDTALFNCWYDRLLAFRHAHNKDFNCIVWSQVWINIIFNKGKHAIIFHNHIWDKQSLPSYWAALGTTVVTQDSCALTDCRSCFIYRWNYHKTKSFIFSSRNSHVVRVTNIWSRIVGHIWRRIQNTFIMTLIISIAMDTVCRISVLWDVKLCH